MMFLPCYLALAVLIMAMSIRTATTDKSKSSFPRVPSLGAAGCGGLGSRGDFFRGREPCCMSSDVGGINGT